MIQRDSSPPRFAVLGTYAPTVGTVASFSAALCAGLEAGGATASVVRVADGSPSDHPRVTGELTSGSSASVAACASLLSRGDVAVIQYDFDVYGGTEGDEVIDVMRAVSVPTIVVVHSVPASPTAGQRAALEAVTALADRVVATSDAANLRLRTDYAVDSQKISTIAYGATIPRAVSLKRPGRPTLLTWGPLGPGAGVERVIDAMSTLHTLSGQPRYLVAGPTHPKVLAADGEAYREARIAQAQGHGLGSSVTFDPTPRGPQALAALVQSCSMVVLPYDTTDEVSSAVLVDAVASGRPVVATAFPHAAELLASGAGVVVQHDDPDAMVAALRLILSDPRISGAMAAEGRRLAPTLAWPLLAKSYIALAQRLLLDKRAYT